MRILLIVSISALISCLINHTEPEKWTISRPPAEFEEDVAVWLIWPPSDHKKGASVQDITCSIIEALIPDLNIVVTCANKLLYDQAERVLHERFKENRI